jgi:hypothetical protein
MNRLRELFNDNKAEELLDKSFKALEKERGCSTCKNKRRIATYPGFVTGEEFECTKGRECDTVLFNVKHCPEWEGIR